MWKKKGLGIMTDAKMEEGKQGLTRRGGGCPRNYHQKARPTDFIVFFGAKKRKLKK